MTIQPQNNILNYLIDPTITNNVNRLLIDYLFCLFQEIITLITEILFHIMYQTLK